MEPALLVALLWLAFGGTHVGLAAHPVRTRLVARLGEGGFLAVFSLVAALGFAALAHVYATHAGAGAVGPDLGRIAPLRWLLLAGIVAGVTLAVPALVTFPSSPYALLAPQRERAPRGLERITRHPFLAGMALLGTAHALLATRLVGTVAFGGLALLAIGGAWHQDRKLLARRGEPYAAWLRATSTIPFAAIAAGRQRLVVAELPAALLALGLGAAYLLRSSHDAIFANGGAYVIAAVVGGGGLELLSSLLRARAHRTDRPPLPLATLLTLTALGHAVVGLVLFRAPLASMVHDGVLGSIGLDAAPERLAAFWFLLYTPVLLLLAAVVADAIARANTLLLGRIGWTLLGLGAVGAAVAPISGFWLVLGIGALTVDAARRPLAAITPR